MSSYITLVGREEVPEITGIAAEVIAQVDLLDQTIAEVFSMMMGISCVPTEDASSPSKEVTAVVGLAGSLSGAYVINVTDAAALHIAGALMGMPATEVDDMVKDSIGEVCNMLAGGWKGRFPQLASDCMLSVPTIVTGKDYRVHIQKPSVRLERKYTFGEHMLSISILCEA
jgi:chemotaxis protein CheX